MMSYFCIKDEEGNDTSYLLVSYGIKVNGENVAFELKSDDFSVSYELRPDTRFSTVDIIKSYLEGILEQVKTNGYVLNVSEYFSRMYVMIGYETSSVFEMRQFTASKLL